MCRGLARLRFRLDGRSLFLAATSGKFPPLVRLNALLHATDAIHSETETAKDLRFLLGAGSPLGGARPKSAVSLEDKPACDCEKFPKPDDTRDIAAGEILALTLAGQSGIQAAEHQLVTVGTQSVAVITRFDRVDKKSEFRLFPRQVYWAFLKVTLVPTRSWLTASASSAMTFPGISANCGVA